VCAFSAARFVDPVVSLPQVRSESETHLTFAARLPAKSARVSIRQRHVRIFVRNSWQKGTKRARHAQPRFNQNY